ncbi:unnamed protein product, partial [Ectocarpus sp. 13 AM-2016]
AAQKAWVSVASAQYCIAFASRAVQQTPQLRHTRLYLHENFQNNCALRAERFYRPMSSKQTGQRNTFGSRNPPLPRAPPLGMAGLHPPSRHRFPARASSQPLSLLVGPEAANPARCSTRRLGQRRRWPGTQSHRHRRLRRPRLGQLPLVAAVVSRRPGHLLPRRRRRLLELPLLPLAL